MGKSGLETFLVLEGLVKVGWKPSWFWRDGYKWAGNLPGFGGMGKSGLETFMVLEEWVKVAQKSS